MDVGTGTCRTYHLRVVISDKDTCNDAACQNGGVCIPAVGSSLVFCECVEGTSGPSCGDGEPVSHPRLLQSLANWRETTGH